MQDIQITPKKLYSILKSPKPINIIDIREDWEREIAYIENSKHIPLSQISENIETLPKNEGFVVICHHGIRSLKTVLWLRQLGYEAYNLIGGINSWSEEIDPNVPKY
jgi:rhodanese-related sulfurtransferase